MRRSFRAGFYLRSLFFFIAAILSLCFFTERCIAKARSPVNTINDKKSITSVDNPINLSVCILSVWSSTIISVVWHQMQYVYRRVYFGACLRLRFTVCIRNPIHAAKFIARMARFCKFRSGPIFCGYPALAIDIFVLVFIIFPCS